jgi:hypothetical protein
MVAASFITLLALAASAVALPSSKERFLARRAARQGKPVSRVPAPHTGAVADNLVKNEQYSSNWAGAVYNSPKGTYKSVTGTFTVPKATGSSGASASAWVGIDGDSCGNAILQTGLDFNAGGSYDGEHPLVLAPEYATLMIGTQRGTSGSPTTPTTSPVFRSRLVTPSRLPLPRLRPRRAPR